MQPHENVRAIVSAVNALHREPLTAKARELLNTITRNANEAADEIEYLQTAASVYRPEEKLPPIYDDCRLSNKERDFVSILFRAKGVIVTRESLMCQIYAKQDAQENKNRQDGVNPKILEAFLWHIRRKLKPFREHLEANGQPAIVETIFGIGYRLVHLTPINAVHEGKYRTSSCVK